MKKIITNLAWLFPICVIAMGAAVAVFVVQVKDHVKAKGQVDVLLAESKKYNDLINNKKVELSKLEEKQNLLQQQSAGLQQQIDNIKKLRLDAEASITDEAKLKAEAAAQIAKSQIAIQEEKVALVKITELKKEETDLEQKLVSLQAEIKSQGNLTKSIADAKLEHTKTLVLKKSLDQMVQELSTDKSTLEAQIKELKATYETTLKTLASSNVKIDNLNKLKAEVATKIVADEELKKMVKETETKLAKLQADFSAEEKTINQSIQKLKAEELKLAASVKSSEDKIQKQTQENARLKTEASTLKGEIAALKEQVEKLKKEAEGK